jgi:hypothetical protein
MARFGGERRGLGGGPGGEGDGAARRGIGRCRRGRRIASFLGVVSFFLFILFYFYFTHPFPVTRAAEDCRLRRRSCARPAKKFSHLFRRVIYSNGFVRSFVRFFPAWAQQSLLPPPISLHRRLPCLLPPASLPRVRQSPPRPCRAGRVRGRCWDAAPSRARRPPGRACGRRRPDPPLVEQPPARPRQARRARGRRQAAAPPLVRRPPLHPHEARHGRQHVGRCRGRLPRLHAWRRPART